MPRRRNVVSLQSISKEIVKRYTRSVYGNLRNSTEIQNQCNGFRVLAWAYCIFLFPGNSQDLHTGSGIRRHASFIIKKMKKNVLFLLVAITLLFTACQKEQSEQENPNVSKLIGVWVETHYWDSSNNDWHTWGFISGFVHEFREDKTYIEYSSLTNYNNGTPFNSPKSYTFDGEYLVIDGGFKEKIIFSEDGNKLIWENEAKCNRYSPNK